MCGNKIKTKMKIITKIYEIKTIQNIDYEEVYIYASMYVCLE